MKRSSLWTGTVLQKHNTTCRNWVKSSRSTSVSKGHSRWGRGISLQKLTFRNAAATQKHQLQRTENWGSYNSVTENKVATAETKNQLASKPLKRWFIARNRLPTAKRQKPALNQLLPQRLPQLSLRNSCCSRKLRKSSCKSSYSTSRNDYFFSATAQHWFKIATACREQKYRCCAA